MPIAYPTIIPSCIEKGSYKRSPIDTVLKSTIEGVVNTRDRHTSEMYNTSWQIRMTQTELNVLLVWYHTILFKVLTFNFVDPIDDQIREYAFIESPVYSHIGGETFIVTFNLETAP